MKKFSILFLVFFYLLKTLQVSNINNSLLKNNISKDTRKKPPPEQYMLNRTELYRRGLSNKNRGFLSDKFRYKESSEYSTVTPDSIETTTYEPYIYESDAYVSDLYDKTGDRRGDRSMADRRVEKYVVDESAFKRCCTNVKSGNLFKASNYHSKQIQQPGSARASQNSICNNICGQYNALPVHIYQPNENEEEESTTPEIITIYEDEDEPPERIIERIVEKTEEDKKPAQMINFVPMPFPYHPEQVIKVDAMPERIKRPPPQTYEQPIFSPTFSQPQIIQFPQSSQPQQQIIQYPQLSPPPLPQPQIIQFPQPPPPPPPPQTLQSQPVIQIFPSSVSQSQKVQPTTAPPVVPQLVAVPMSQPDYSSINIREKSILDSARTISDLADLISPYISKSISNSVPLIGRTEYTLQNTAPQILPARYQTVVQRIVPEIPQNEYYIQATQAPVYQQQPAPAYLPLNFVPQNTYTQNSNNYPIIQKNPSPIYYINPQYRQVAENQQAQYPYQSDQNTFDIIPDQDYRYDQQEYNPSISSASTLNNPAPNIRSVKRVNQHISPPIRHPRDSTNIKGIVVGRQKKTENRIVSRKVSKAPVKADKSKQNRTKPKPSILVAKPSRAFIRHIKRQGKEKSKKPQQLKHV